MHTRDQLVYVRRVAPFTICFMPITESIAPASRGTSRSIRSTSSQSVVIVGGRYEPVHHWRRSTVSRVDGRKEMMDFASSTVIHPTLGSVSRRSDAIDGTVDNKENAYALT
jgi:hypothetical protein